MRKPPSGPAIGEDSPEGETQRKKTAEFILGNNSNREWESTGLQLGYRYDGSPIIVPDGSPTDPVVMSDYVPSAQPGARAPHAWLQDGRSTLDLFGAGFTLLQFTPEADGEKLLGIQNVPISIILINDAAIHDLYAADLVLVRPDGHVAWRGNNLPEDVEGLIDIVRGA